MIKSNKYKSKKIKFNTFIKSLFEILFNNKKIKKNCKNG